MQLFAPFHSSTFAEESILSRTVRKADSAGLVFVGYASHRLTSTPTPTKLFKEQLKLEW